MDRAALRLRLPRVLIAAGVMLAAVLGAGMLLPANWQIERAQFVAASPEALFRALTNLKHWHEWSACCQAEPGAPVEYSGSETGTGATARWSRGGRRIVLKLMDTQRHRRVDYELLMDGGLFTLRGEIRLVPEERGTRVVWRAFGQSGSSPFERYAALYARYRSGIGLDAALAGLKSRLEDNN